MSTPLALVTGASGGIGRVIAARLSNDGWAVLVHYSSNDEGAAEVVSDLREAGASAWSVQADLSSDCGMETLAHAVDRITAAHPAVRLRAVVNNASALLGPSFGHVDAGVFEQFFNLNVRAPLLLTQLLVQKLSDGGCVVNISSAAAHFASPGDIVYAMSKTALEAFTRHAAPALAERGIRINTVIPGFTDNGHPAFLDPHIRAHMASFAVMGDVSPPEVVADAVAFLLSDGASRTTGANLDVSGGSTLGARRSRSAHVSLRDVARRHDA